MGLCKHVAIKLFLPLEKPQLMILWPWSSPLCSLTQLTFTTHSAVLPTADLAVEERAG